MFKRCIEISNKSQKSVFLFGARGTGKTSWVKQNFDPMIYVDLLDGETFRALAENTSLLEQMIPRNYSGWVVIDEVQRLPDLLNQVHRLIENRGIRFVLTGSSARKLRRGQANLLAGRALTYNFHPLTAYEMGEAFVLEDALKYGMIAGVIAEENPAKYLQTYVQTYLQEEVIDESAIRNIQAFYRFPEVASYSQGSLINYSEIGRDIGVSSNTVASYFQIFHDLLLSQELPVFSRRSKRRLVKQNKFYYFDVGIYRQLRPQGPLDSPGSILGVAYESLFFQNLRAINDYFEFAYTLYFWRTSNQMEVDFVLYGERGLLAFEVKSSAKFKKSDLRGLKSFARDYPMAKLYLIYGGNLKLYVDGVEIIPMSEALIHLPDLLS